MPETPAPRPGDPKLRHVHDDRYAQFRVLGQGGMGIVYWALDTDLNRQVAFKVVRPDAGQSDADTPAVPLTLSPPADDSPISQAFATLKARFLQEAWVTAGLEHPGIVPVYEVGQTPDGVPFYTMQFVRGSRTLAKAMDEAFLKTMEHRIALLEPFLKVCDTIRYAHAHGVLHRDLKPDNIALGEFGEVVVLDWGLAKMKDLPDVAGATWRERVQEFRDAADLKTQANAMGTPGYMSPEAALGRTETLDGRSDVFSLGAMLFQLLTGRLPFARSSYGEFVRQLLNDPVPEASAVDSEVPQGLSSICVKALARNPDERYASVDAFQSDIRAWMRDRERDIEAAALFSAAVVASEGLEALKGEELLRRIDRLQGLCARVLAVHPEHERAAVLAAEADVFQERAISERERAVRRRTRHRAVAVILVLACLTAATVAVVTHGKRLETEESLTRAHDDHDRTVALLAQKDDALRRTKAARLVAESELLRVTTPDRSLPLLLALEANRIQPSLVARNAVLAALSPSGVPMTGSGPPADSAGGDVVVRSADARRTASRGSEAASGGDRVVVVRDAATGDEVCQLRGHTGTVRAVAFSPDGSRILTGSDDSTARLWHSTSGEELLTIPVTLFGPVTSVGFTDTNEPVAAARDALFSRTWPADPVAVASAALPREFTDAERARYEIERPTTSH